jgi:hypothetical protein
MRTARRIVLVAVVMSAAVACSGSKVNVAGPDKATFAQIEEELGHKVAQPKAALGATLVASALVPSSSGTFQGTTAGASYRWKEVLALVRQGRPNDGFALHEFIKRGDVIYETRAGGVEVAFLPQVGEGITSAYIVSADWLIQVDIAPAKGKVTIPLDDLKAFVNAMEL